MPWDSSALNSLAILRMGIPGTVQRAFAPGACQRSAPATRRDEAVPYAVAKRWTPHCILGIPVSDVERSADALLAPGAFPEFPVSFNEIESRSNR